MHNHPRPDPGRGGSGGPKRLRTRRLDHGSRRRIIGVAAAGACLIAAAAGVNVAQNEWTVQAITAAMLSPDASIRGQILEDYADTPATALPLRAQAALAQVALNAAAQTPQPDLHLLYDERARSVITNLRTAAPDWPATLLLSTQLELRDHGHTTPRALADYERSYRAAPFLWQEARWRIAFGTLNWSALSPATRQAMIEEAVWLTHVNGDLRPEVEALLGDTPAAVRYQLRMAEKPQGEVEG